MNSCIRLAVAIFFFTGTVVFGQLPMSCQLNEMTAPNIRADGYSELLGDVVLTCTGGTPTPLGQPVPLVSVALTLNTWVASRPIGTHLGPGNVLEGYIDSLLLIDEPYPSTMIVSSTWPRPPNHPAQTLCYSSANASPGACNYLLGNGGGGYESTSSPYLQPGTFTIYAGQYDGNQITWAGVPIDPPGTGALRLIRLTNVRADAEEWGVSPVQIPTQIVGLVSIDNAEIGEQTLSYDLEGKVALDTSFTLCGCPSHNASLLGETGTPTFDGTIQVTEGFAASFKRRNIGVTADGVTPPPVYAQNVPGYPYTTETGFLPSLIAISNPGYALKPADSGTRILLLFSNVPQGVHIFLPVSIALQNSNPPPGYPSNVGIANGQIQLIQAQMNGFSGQGYTSLATSAIVGTTPVAEASRTGTTLSATYEVVNSDPTAIETANIPVAIAFTGSMNLSGDIVATVLLAPLSAIQSSVFDEEPLPRFAAFQSSLRPPPIAGDFDSSGVPDRVWEEDATGKATLHYTGYTGVDLGTWNWLNSTAVPTWHIVGVADFNGDGVPDLVWQDSVTREVVVHYEGGAGGAVLQSWKWLQSSAVPGWTVEAVADFNGDGVPDLVWQEDATGKVVVHYYGSSGGAVFQGWNWLQSAPVPGWTVVGAGDFNRDGVPDLVWQSNTTGQVTVHYYGGAGGAVLQSWNWLNKADGPQGWTVKAVSDVNGDGVPDLLWQNSSTHQVTVHYYGGPGGASLIGWNWISQAGVPGWSVVH